jgi:redox-sensitive bicupin YhaK (pirin superfamily)
MGAPRYQEVSAATIPLVELEGAAVRVVAGVVNGVSGPVSEIAADPLYLDVELKPGASFSHPIPAGHTAIAYLYEGQGEFGIGEDTPGQQVEALHMLAFSDGDYLKVQAAPETTVRFMLVAGAPFKEPTVPYGPFVMNTDDEIRQALSDLRNGTFVS